MRGQGQVSPIGKRYRSKIDGWLLAVLVAAFALTLLPLIVVVILLVHLPSAWLIVVLPLLIWAGVLSLLFPLYYEITRETLVVRSGWLHYRIPLASIHRIFPTHNPLSAPALSLDRLQVEYLQANVVRSILISPAEKTGFLQDLAQVAPDLQVQGDQLVRGS
jgi:uncharacterized membrane protein YdbT with pleckstrin-like domain